MSEDKHNLNYIKKKLQSYQLSTVTSGLNGDDRYEELKYRLESYEKQLDGSQRDSSGSNSSSRVDDSNVGGSSFQVPSLNSLSIGEVRARLAVLGMYTSVTNCLTYHDGDDDDEGPLIISMMMMIMVMI
jgi:hypothetical protein